MPELLVQQICQAVQTRPWIRRVEHQVVGKVARLRLFLADDRFVAVYYNAQTGSISYAYIEGEQRPRAEERRVRPRRRRATRAGNAAIVRR